MNISTLLNTVKSGFNAGTVKKLLLIGSGFAKKNAPQFLTAMSVISLGGTAVATAKGTVAAKDAIEEAEMARYRAFINEHGYSEKPAMEQVLLPLEQKVKIAWKYYIPAALSAVTSAGCAIASTSIYADRYATVAAMLALAETDNKELKDKIETLLGKEATEKIQEAVMGENVDKSMKVEGENKCMPIDEKEVTTIITDTERPFKCVDDFGNEWWSTPQKISDAIEMVNARLKRDDLASLNDFYNLAGASLTKAGDDFGWHIEWQGDEIRIQYSFFETFDHEVRIGITYWDKPESCYLEI